MLEKVREIPPKYYQLALFNIGVIIAVSKGYSILHIVSSLAFITVLAAPIAIYLKILEQGKVQIIHEEIQAKIAKLWSSSVEFLKNWNEVE